MRRARMSSPPLELERIMNAAGPTKGHLERLSDGKAPKEMVFIQCVGSRCADDRGKSYCSKICCMYTAKHAMLIRDKYPDVNVTVFYIDVRTPGKNFDEFYRRAVEEYGVNYIKGQVGKVLPQPDGKLLVRGVRSDRQPPDLKGSRYGRSGGGNRAESGRKKDRHHADCKHRYEQLPDRGACEAASGRVSDWQASSSPACARDRRTSRRPFHRQVRRP